MTININRTKSGTRGTFLITPMTRALKCGAFTAQLSVRRGRGTQTHDRVYTFSAQFPCRDTALIYASEQGRNWLINPAAFA